MNISKKILTIITLTIVLASSSLMPAEAARKNVNVNIKIGDWN